jgi:hypothetical protein
LKQELTVKQERILNEFSNWLFLVKTGEIYPEWQDNFSMDETEELYRIISQIKGEIS